MTAKSMGVSRYLWPSGIGVLLIVCVVAWLASEISRGALLHIDELRTAERSREMLLKGRGTVYFNFAHTFAKPPLQYWLTTLSLPRFGNSSAAVRIWPLFYGMLTAFAVGWLAYLVDSKRPWLVPLSVAIFVSCPLFLAETTRALLDMGLTLFATLAIVFAQLARKQPAWWLGVAIVCWLGALQKIPLIFLIWLIMVLVRARNASERPALQSYWLVASAILATGLTAVWPLIQIVKYQMPMARAFTGDEFARLFGAGNLGARSYVDVLTGLVTNGWVGASFTLLLAIALLFSKKRNFPAPVIELIIIALAVIGLFWVFSFRALRYALPVLPCLSVLAALFLHRALEQGRNRRAYALGVIAVILLAGLVQGKMKFNSRARDAFDQRQVAQRLGALQSEGANPVWIRSPRMLFDSFYLFYGNLSCPLQKRTLEDLRKLPDELPLAGVCEAHDFSVVQEIYPRARIELASGEFICWRAAASD